MSEIACARQRLWTVRFDKMFRGVVVFTLVVVFLGSVVMEESEEEEEEDYTEAPPPDGPPLVPMAELISSFGYKSEEHVVTTKDGYQLDLYHLICDAKPTGAVALLVHGLMASAEIYVLKNNSVGYQLCDQGVDVWLPSMRATVHGRKHESLNANSDEKFWDGSYADVGLYDIPAAINYVKEKTKAPQLYYLGHSLGTTVFFVMLSTNPEIVASIKEALLMAPVVFATKFQFMLKEGSSMYNMSVETLNGFKAKKLWEAFPRADVEKTEHQIGCEHMPEMAVGYCNMGFDMARPMVGDYLPAGTSLKNLEHLAQTYTKGKIAFYDYGSEEENHKIYGLPAPPAIDLKKATVKTHLFYCEADHAVAPQDVETLKGELPNLGTTLYIEDENFNHADFLFPMSEDTEKLFDNLMGKVKDIIK